MGRAWIATVLATALVAGAGCKKKEREVDCGMAGKAWVELAHHQLEVDGDAERRAKAEALVPALREELVKRCSDEGWSLVTRRCIVDARSPAELERCEPGAGPAAGPAAEAATPAAPSPP
jgi:hypothetical protein